MTDIYYPIVDNTTYTAPYSYLDEFCSGNYLGSAGTEVRPLLNYKEQSLRPMSREKPSSLLQSMTALPLQYRRTTRSGTVVFIDETTPGCWVDEPVYGYTGTLKQVHTLVHNNIVSPFNGWLDAPDWVTPLRNQVNDLSISLGQDLAEYRQTADLFHDTAEFLYDSWQWARKKKRALRRLNLRDLAAADIIKGFGYDPLIGLIDESINVLNGKLGQPTHVKLVQTARSQRNGSRIDSPGTEYQGKGHQSITKTAKVYIRFDRPPPVYQLGNAASIAWEVVPWSFLIDYMIPVGDYLSAIDALVDVGGVYGTVTTRRSLYFSTTATDAAGPGVLTQNVPCVRHYESHEREVIDEIPPPPFPKWKPSASWHKLRHAVALLYLQRSK